MDSPKARTNKRWTSSEQHRANWDRIFRKGTAEEAQARLNPYPNAEGWSYDAWKEGFLAPVGTMNPYVENSQLTEAWDDGRKARQEWEA